MDEDQKSIYFHVGLGKTGTTWLQYRVFPKFKGIQYIQRTRYKHSKDIIRSSSHKRIFLSREFDQQLEAEIRDFAVDFPDTHPIIVFRRQESWIASQYRRFTKNGFGLRFDQFIDLEEDKGYFRRKDLEFYNKIRLLEETFTHPPLVLFHEDLKKEPMQFIRHIAEFTGASFAGEDIDLQPKHRSYREKQLKAIQWLTGRINIRKRRVFSSSILHLLWRFGLSVIRYSTLYISGLLPDSFFSKDPLIHPSQLEAIRREYEDDYQRCLEYSRRQRAGGRVFSS